MNDITIIGAGIGGLTLSLKLHSLGISSTIYEAANKIEPLGVGINLQPYATEIMNTLGVLKELEESSITTKEFVFCNHHGQVIYKTFAGRFAQHKYPQLSIHRGVLQQILLDTVIQRMGLKAVITGHTFISSENIDNQLKVNLIDSSNNKQLLDIQTRALIAADGIHSTVYNQIIPTGPSLNFSGIHLWRGISQYPKFLSGASMERAGLPDNQKLVAYPIRNINDDEQLINWVAEIREEYCHKGISANSIHQYFKDWQFDWLNIPDLLSKTITPILTQPAMDRDPLNTWGHDNITLLGDSAHPMLPLGSNGAEQAILDAEYLAGFIEKSSSITEAFRSYEAIRIPLTRKIVLGDRAGIVDQLVREVNLRSKGQPFNQLSALISEKELQTLSVPNYQLFDQ